MKYAAVILFMLLSASLSYGFLGLGEKRLITNNYIVSGPYARLGGDAYFNNLEVINFTAINYSCKCNNTGYVPYIGATSNVNLADKHLIARKINISNPLTPALNAYMGYNASAFNYFLDFGPLNGVIRNVLAIDNVALVRTTTVDSSILYASDRIEVKNMQVYADTAKNITFYNGSGNGFANLNAHSFNEYTTLEANYDADKLDILPEDPGLMVDDRGYLVRSYMYDNERADNQAFKDYSRPIYNASMDITGYGTMIKNGSNVGAMAFNNRLLIAELKKEITALKLRIDQLQNT